MASGARQQLKYQNDLSGCVAEGHEVGGLRMGFRKLLKGREQCLLPSTIDREEARLTAGRPGNSAQGPRGARPGPGELTAMQRHCGHAQKSVLKRQVPRELRPGNNGSYLKTT